MRNKPKFATCDVCAVVRSIPPKKVVTYGDISVALTNETKSAQAVSGCVASLGEDFSFDVVPVHRVVKSKGYIPTKKGVKEKNTKELKKECVCVLKDGDWKVKNFKKSQWTIPKYNRSKNRKCPCKKSSNN